jgi:hypothetical protein
MRSRPIKIKATAAAIAIQPRTSKTTGNLLTGAATINAAPHQQSDYYSEIDTPILVHDPHDQLCQSVRDEAAPHGQHAYEQAYKKDNAL